MFKKYCLVTLAALLIMSFCTAVTHATTQETLNNTEPIASSTITNEQPNTGSDEQMNNQTPNNNEQSDPDANSLPESQKEEHNTEAVIEDEPVGVTFVVSGAQKFSSVTFKVKGNSTKTLTCGKDNNWTVPTDLKIGEYSITDVNGDVGSLQASFANHSFVVNNKNGQTINLSVIEAEKPYTIKNLLRNNTFFLIGIAGCCIALAVLKKKGVTMVSNK